MIKDSILDRFSDKQVIFRGQPFTITAKSIEFDRARECVDLFNACVDQFCKPPTKYPFDVSGIDRNLLIFGIDECQVSFNNSPDFINFMVVLQQKICRHTNRGSYLLIAKRCRCKKT